MIDSPGVGTAALTDMLAPLTAADPADAETLNRLRGSLARRAQAAGILDVAYRILETPVGPLLLAATERGLVRVAYASQDHDRVLQQLAERLSPRILNAPERLDAVAREIDEYFAGIRIGFDIPLDFSLATGFRRDVLAHLTEIGYGHTESYAQVAIAAGHPRAFRAVGSACATNPLPLVVPCHRVVRSDGALGEYAGGASAKRMLLSLEAAA